jgi:hypothetical protein
MSRLENNLRDALKREDPPAGFAERVIAHTLETRQNRWTGIFARSGLRWGFAAVLCLAIMAAGLEYRQVQIERARSEAAKEQLLLALRIAGEQLQFVWNKMNQP